MFPEYTSTDARFYWTKLPEILKENLQDAQELRDFCALECLANDPHYAKPDSQKIFLLWRAYNRDGIIVHTDEIARRDHPWVYSLFIDTDNSFIRFPFNVWDTDLEHSLSWKTIREDLRVESVESTEEHLLEVCRWSTASRSCLVLIPERVELLGPTTAFRQVCPQKRFEVEALTSLNVPEWADRNTMRFYTVIQNPGQAAQSGVEHRGNDDSYGRYRLYSVKTGVDYVGNRFEGDGFGKNKLEANCEMAMTRSKVIRAMRNRDPSFGVQTEILTITAPIKIMTTDAETGEQRIEECRDGFQVRDLSCMQRGLNFIPGQAIPYARAAFDRLASCDPKKPTEISKSLIQSQCNFWRKNFAVPLGRAKARLFLNYGLIHTSANAQNFLVGFNGSVPKQFVVRDIGDTSWHDDYLEKYFRDTGTNLVYREFNNERTSLGRALASYHLLRATSSGDYPPPYIMRLAAQAVLTHSFWNVLQDRHGWTLMHVYRFATGILDGFRMFMEANLKIEPRYPIPNPWVNEAENIEEYGSKGIYPFPYSTVTQRRDNENAYRALIDQLLGESAETLFAKAARVRQLGNEKVQNNKDILTYLNAEEVLLCAGFERLLVRVERTDKDKEREDKERQDKFKTTLLARILTGEWSSVVAS